MPAVTPSSASTVANASAWPGSAAVLIQPFLLAVDTLGVASLSPDQASATLSITISSAIISPTTQLLSDAEYTSNVNWPRLVAGRIRVALAL